MRWKPVSVGCAVVLLAAAAGTCFGVTEVLDQDVTFSDLTYHVISPEYSLGQTFTAGQTGVLSRTEAWIFRGTPGTYPVVLQVRQVLPGGSPFGAVLASVTVPADGLPQVPTGHLANDITPLSVDWSGAGIAVTAGEQLGLVAMSDQPRVMIESYFWRRTLQNHDAYAGGATWVNGSAESDRDAWMRSYMLVPEPGVAGGMMVVAGSSARPARGKEREVMGLVNVGPPGGRGTGRAGGVTPGANAKICDATTGRIACLNNAA